MAAAWMMSVDYLVAVLNNWLSAHSTATFTLHLFKNDYVPVDATLLADLVEADFTGYAMVNFDGADFGGVTWAPYTAQTILDHFITFTADPALSSPQTTYGYYVVDEDTNLLWAERWEVPFEFEASSVLNVKPALRQKTCRE